MRDKGRGDGRPVRIGRQGRRAGRGEVGIGRDGRLDISGGQDEGGGLSGERGVSGGGGGPQREGRGETKAQSKNERKGGKPTHADGGDSKRQKQQRDRQQETATAVRKTKGNKAKNGHTQIGGDSKNANTTVKRPARTAPAARKRTYHHHHDCHNHLHGHHPQHQNPLTISTTDAVNNNHSINNQL